MTVLPIVARELRVASRRWVTYYLRTGAALLVVVVGTWFFLMSRDSPAHETAMVLFVIMTASSVLYCLLSGVRTTADCLSEEKREGTLGLLFLTDLKGYDVVLGKLVASSVNSFYGVLAVVPMLAIPLLLGGVALGEVGRVALVALNTLFFSLALGMSVSAMSHSARKAMAMTFLIMIVFTGLFPACGAYLAFAARKNSIDPFFLVPSPGYSYVQAFDTLYRVNPDRFWCSLLVVHGLGWLFLCLASVVAPRSWQDRPAGVQRLRWRERWQLWSYGDLEERNAFRRRLLGANAFFWLASRARLKPAYVWAILGLFACGWVWGIAKYHDEWFNGGTYAVTAILLNLLLKGWFTAEVGRQLAEDRKSGALELLLSTPLSVRDILRGQALALQRQFLGPLIVLLCLGWVFMLAGPRTDWTSEESSLWYAIWIGAMAMLAVDIVALFWVGSWQALTAKNPNRAPSGTLARIIILPALAWAMVCLIRTLTGVRGDQGPTWKFFLGWYFGLGLIADFGFANYARQKLLTEFRIAAAQRYSPRDGVWKWLLGGAPSKRPEASPIISPETG
jgi:ABC-type Na+ efflux pump permease subunit